MMGLTNESRYCHDPELCKTTLDTFDDFGCAQSHTEPCSVHGGNGVSVDTQENPSNSMGLGEVGPRSTSRYTQDMLDGAEPLSAHEVRNDYHAARVVVDAVDGAPWYGLAVETVEPGGPSLCIHLTREQMLEIAGRVERAVHEGDAFAAWVKEQEAA